MRAFITKYALTHGIFEVEVELVKAGMVRTTAEPPSYYHHSEWHASRDGAIDQATKMLHNKIKSLKTQLAAAEKRDADPDWPQIKFMAAETLQS